MSKRAQPESIDIRNALKLIFYDFYVGKTRRVPTRCDPCSLLIGSSLMKSFSQLSWKIQSSTCCQVKHKFRLLNFPRADFNLGELTLVFAETKQSSLTNKKTLLNLTPTDLQ